MSYCVEVITKYDDFVVINFDKFAFMVFNRQEEWEILISMGERYKVYFENFYKSIDRAICSTENVVISDSIFRQALEIKRRYVHPHYNDAFERDFWMFLVKNFSGVRSCIEEV